MGKDVLRVLVVEDDPAVAAATVRGLRDAGMSVELATTTEGALSAARTFAPRVVVLDLGLPDGEGSEIIARLRGAFGACVIVVTARTELRVRLDVLASGADDYLPKPFYLEELVARIRARTSVHIASRRCAWAGVEVELDERRVSLADVDLPLTRAELGLLLHLVERKGRAVTRDSLARAVLDPDADPRTLDSHVARLRSKLGKAGAAIRTVWGIGYRFDPEPA